MKEEGKYYIGVDIGGMSIKIGLVDSLGNLLISKSIVTNREDYTITASRILECIDGICKEHAIDKLLGIGVGVPGIVNSKDGIVSRAVNVDWYDIPLKKELKNRYTSNIVIGNDANCAALGEYYYGLDEKVNNAVLVTFGTGIGGGIIIDGKLYTGNGFAAGEVGHMVIVHNGIACNCTKNGCWEQYASVSALIRQTNEAIEKYPDSLLSEIAQEDGVVDGKTAFKAARKNDEVAVSVVERYIEYINCGLHNLTNILHPECFIIGGGLSNEGEHLIDMIQWGLDNLIETTGFLPTVKVVAAKLGNEAGMLGAARLCIE